MISKDEQFEEYYRICIGRRKKKGWAYSIEYEKVLLPMKRIEVNGNY
jgi:hypothetical protein